MFRVQGVIARHDGNRVHESSEAQGFRRQQRRKEPEAADARDHQRWQGSLWTLLHGMPRVGRAGYRRAVRVAHVAAGALAHFGGCAVIHRWAIAMDYREWDCAFGYAGLKGNS